MVAGVFTVAAVTGEFRSYRQHGTNDSMENELMCNRDFKITRLRSRLTKLVARAVCPLLLTACVLPVLAQTSATSTFTSPEEASLALFQAAQRGDEQRLEAILGAGKDVTSSGDEVEDALEHERFTQKYQEMHRLVREADGNTILYIGAENWPFPIPLVSSKGVWHFDSDAGKQEILFRAIGENEVTAIEVCTAFAVARKQSNNSAAGNDPISGYAQSLVSPSASDPNVAPFHGYYFHSKKINGRVALIAYPAKYRSSGVKTFLVTQDGVVFEKDLGPKTKPLALKVHSLDSSWQPAE